MCTIKYYSHSFTAFLKVNIVLSCAKVKSSQIWGCVNSDPKVPALTTAITHPLSGGGGGVSSPLLRLPVWNPEVKLTAAAATFCLWEPHWCSSPSPHRGRTGFPSAVGRKSRWVCVALHFLKCGRIFSDHRRRPYLRHHGPALHHVTAETWRDSSHFPHLLVFERQVHSG